MNNLKYYHGATGATGPAGAIGPRGFKGSPGIINPILGGTGGLSLSFDNITKQVKMTNGYLYNSSLTSIFSNTYFNTTSLPNDSEDFFYNTAFGFDCLSNGTSSIVSNLAIGNSTMNRLDSNCIANLSIGSFSLSELNTGNANIAIGTLSLPQLINGEDNISIGVYSMYVSQGNRNTTLGNFSLSNLTTGNDNITIGYSSGINMITSNNNIIIGQYSANSLTSGNNNIIIGDYSGGGIISGNNNISIGNSTVINADISNSIFIDTLQTQFPDVSNNAFYVNPIRATTNVVSPLVYDPVSMEIRYTTSSKEYKTNIIPIKYDTSKIFDINIVEYDEKETNIHCTGFIAEEVEKIDKNLIYYNKDKVGGVHHYNMTVYLINECKKMRKELNIMRYLIFILFVKIILY